MKKFFVKSLDKIVLSLLAIFGFANCETPTEYGSPHANFEFKGNITDSITGKPIENIRIQVVDSGSVSHNDTLYTYGFTVSTGYSASTGKYDLNASKECPEDSVTYYLKVDDIDGIQNGGEFESKKIAVTIKESEWSGTKTEGWVIGKESKTQDIKLKKK